MNQVWIASTVVLWIVVVLLAFFLAGALRQLGILQLRLGTDPGALITDSGLDRGTHAPDFEAPDAETGEVRTFSERSRRARVLTFLTPTCIACRHLIPHLNEVAQTRGAEFDFFVVCTGDPEGCRSLARMERLMPPMLIDASGDIQASFHVALSPFTYLIDYSGRVLIRGVANDWKQLEALLDQEGTYQGISDTDESDPSQQLSEIGELR